MSVIETPRQDSAVIMPSPVDLHFQLMMSPPDDARPQKQLILRKLRDAAAVSDGLLKRI